MGRMVNYGIASTFLLSSILVSQNFHLPNAFIPNGSPLSLPLRLARPRTVIGVRSVSITANQVDSDDSKKNTKSSVNLTSITNDKQHDYEEAPERQEQVTVDKETGKPIITYEVTFPLTRASKISATSENQLTERKGDADIAKSFGFSLSSILTGGKLSEMALEIDTLNYVYQEEKMSQKKLIKDESIVEKIGSIQKIPRNYTNILGGIFNGIVVSNVIRGSLAWNAGVRAGDIVKATSATLGDNIWPKSTLEGVRSAISSRSLLSTKIKFQFARVREIGAEEKVAEEFELSIARPMGINIEETEEGYIQITGFTNQASELVTSNLRIYDRIIFVDSWREGSMLPVTDIEGLVSACTTRLPGQPVKLRFQRLAIWDREMSNTSDDATTLSSQMSRATTLGTKKSKENKMLLSRCCDVLQRYISVYDATAEKTTGVPALVADRVMESLADASASLDAKTLSLVMNSYITCNNPKKAIEAFEAAVGLAADGSSYQSDDFIIKGKKLKSQIVADDEALNLFTASMLLRAHAKLGNFQNARRVLASIEGDNMVINEVSSFRWPGKIKTDTKCYNAVLDACSKIGKEAGLEMALELYQSMAEPVPVPTRRPKKTLVTYNIMIAAYARSGLREEAFEVFLSLREAGIKADKFTVTSLIKAAVEDGDVEGARVLLNEMDKNGIKADVVAYNTIIQHLCLNMRLRDAQQFVVQMEENGISPNGKTYGLLMNGLLKSKKASACLTLFESACADSRTVSLTENVKLYTTAITAAATLGDIERATDLLSRMTFAGVKPNIKTLTVLMGGCISAGIPERAIEVYRKIERPDGYAMNLAVRAYCNSIDFTAAFDLLKKENDGKHVMSKKEVVTGYNFLIRSALKEMKYELARSVLDEILRAGYTITAKTFKAIIEGLNLSAGIDDESVDRLKKFDFLLFVIDSLDKKKMLSNGYFYSCILTEGIRAGGLRKKIATLMLKQKQIDTRNLIEQVNTDALDASNEFITWEQLLQNYSQYRDVLDQFKLPSIRVRINSHDSKGVYFAENKLTYRERNIRKTQSVTNESSLY